MRCKHQTIERQQEVLLSPFDINTHKETFISYLEVVISPEGVVEYAVPSHSEKLVEIFLTKRKEKCIISIVIIKKDNFGDCL